MFRAPPAAPRDDLSAKVRAVLGPTNTGKTHLAIERLCAHSSGAIGFPLRLLAREVYDRVRAIKGEREVALITGEERIEPKDARWLLCTVEAMPVNRGQFAFVAVDEAQLGADRERGHVFTDRLLHARGREETMILGSATVEPLVRALVPEAEIVSRPRFSTLSYAGGRKLSRIPPRSAIVAFSAEQVYAIAEMLRRFRGGAAVVMGALSPETRNRQVALYQSGEVDYHRRHRRDRHGAQPRYRARRVRRPQQVRWPAPAPAHHRRNGADCRARRASSARRQLRNDLGR